MPHARCSRRRSATRGERDGGGSVLCGGDRCRVCDAGPGRARARPGTRPADGLLRDQRRFRKRRKTRRHCMSGPTQPDPRDRGGRRHPHLARLPEHAGSERRQCARSHRVRPLVQRKRRPDRAQRERASRRGGRPRSQHHEGVGAHREGCDGSGTRRHSESPRHPHGLATRRDGVSGGRRSDLSQLAQPSNRQRPGWSSRWARWHRLELGSRVERLQPGPPAGDGRRWLVLLLRVQVVRWRSAQARVTQPASPHPSVPWLPVGVYQEVG